jgi:hypothetical protein
MIFRRRLYQSVAGILVACSFLLAGSFSIHAAATSSQGCATPPANFDPLSASDSIIALYGLPKRPAPSAGQAELASWTYAMQHAKHHVCSTPTARPDIHFNALSANWAGYTAVAPPPYASGTQFRGAQGYYTPHCASGSYNTKVGTWVGMGGIKGQNLLQGGIAEDNAEQYGGSGNWWVEFYPSAPLFYNLTSMPYSCGDQGYTYVDYNYSYSGKSYVFIEDVTNGHYEPVTSSSFVPDQTTVEWIDERPGCSGGIDALANFQSTAWIGEAWVVKTDFRPIGQLSYTATTMTNYGTGGGATLAQPGNLYNAGGYTNAGFTDTWYNTGTSSC